MCGLLGLVGPKVLGGQDEQARVFHAALDMLSHRGPDSEGIYGAEAVLLGHRRLAILDLSPSGHQPMLHAGSGTVLVFNGEIYNYRELRDELIAAGIGFEGTSDTEVVLKAFVHWGESCFQRFNGMWAIALWEPARRRLTLSRDRFGVKPLCYAFSGDRFLFASEPKAILALEPSLAEADGEAIHELFVESRSQAGSRAFCKSIRNLPPGSVATMSPGDVALGVRRFWDYPAVEPVSGSPSDAIAMFESLFEDAVRLRLRSDVPVGLTLSGGIDSTAVLSAARANGNTLHCFTSVYGNGLKDEAHWARKAAEVAGAPLEAVAADVGDWSATLSRIVWHMDSPGYSPAVFPLWSIMAHARASGRLVLLEGQGADELLAGYAQHAVVALLGTAGDVVKGRAPLSSLLSGTRGLREQVSARMALLWTARLALAPLSERFGPQKERRAMLRAQSPVPDDPDLPELVPGHAPLQRQLFRDHARDILPALLHYGDAISMAHGIESRLPFMDYRLVEWVFRSAPVLVKDGWSKWPVRGYLRLKGQGEIAARADKLGYVTPLDRWMTSAAGRDLLESMFDSNGPLRDWFDMARVRPMVDRAEGGDALALNHSYKLVTTHIWLEQLKAARNARGGPSGQAAPSPLAAVGRQV